MAERLAYLEAVVGADITNFRRGMRDVREDIGGISGLGAGLQSVGKDMTLAVTAPLIALATGAIAASAGFDSEMHNIGAVAGITGDQLKDLGQQVLEFGETTRAGPTAAAQSIYEAFSAGITDTATAMSVLQVANATAEAGQADLQGTTQALLATFNAYGGQAMNAADATRMLQSQSDIYTRMVAVGVGTLDQFSGSMGKVIPTAVSLGVEFGELGGSMAFLTQRSLSPATAATSINAALSSMLKPSDAMTEAFKTLGVESGEELVSQFGGLEGAIKALAETTGGSQTKLNDLFQSRQAIRAVSLFVQNLDTYDKALRDFNAGTDGATGKAREEQLKSFSAQWDLLKSSVTGLAITVGNILMPVITPMIQGLAGIVNNLSNANPAVLQLGVALLTAAAAAGPLLFIFGSLLSIPGLIVAAFAGLGLIIAGDVGGIKTAITDGLTGIIDDSGLGSLADGIAKILFPEDTKTKMTDAITGAKVSVAPDAFVEVKVKQGDSLWSIWFSQFKDTYSWEDFKKHVGWEEGHVLHAGDVLMVPTSQFQTEVLGMFDNIKIKGTDLINKMFGLDQEVKAPPMRMVADGNAGGNGNDLLEKSFEDRLNMAVTVFNARAPALLAPIVTAVTSWFDTQVGAGLTGISKLFDSTAATGEGNGTIYTAVSDLLRGDVTKAIDDVLPGLGTNIENSLSNWKINIENATPKIQAALGDLIKNVGDWLLNEGIPTLSRTIGNVGGRLAVSLYTALDSAMTYAFGGGAAADASSVKKAIEGYAGTGIVDPMKEGFNDAIKGTKLESTGIPDLQATLDKIVKPLQDLSENPLFTNLVTNFQKFGDGVSDMVTKITTADYSGLTKLTGGILTIAITLGGNILGALGDGLSVLGSAFFSIQAGLSALMAGDPVTALRDFGAGIVELALSLLRIPAGLIDKVIELFNNLTHLNIPSLGGLIDKLKGEIDKALQTPVNIGMIDITATGVAVQLPDGTMNVDVSDMAAVRTAMGDAIANNIQAALDAAPPNVKVTHVNVDTTNMFNGGLGGVVTILDDSLATENPLLALQAAATVQVTTDGSTTATLAPGSPIPTATIDDLMIKPGNVTADLGAAQDSIAQAVLPTGTLATHLETEASAAATSMSTALTNSFAAGGIVDPKIVTDNFLVPLEATFTDYLGPKGTTLAVITGFTTSVDGQFGAVKTSISGVLLQTIVTMTGTAVALMASKPVINGLLAGIKTAVDSLKDAFKDMGAAAQAALGTASGTPGAPSYGGGKAVGGGVLGGTTYLVGEKGPELFTAPGSGTIIPNDALFSKNSGSQTSNVTNNENHFHEVSDLNSILYEANRRGIKLA